MARIESTTWILLFHMAIQAAILLKTNLNKCYICFNFYPRRVWNYSKCILYQNSSGADTRAKDTFSPKSFIVQGGGAASKDPKSDAFYWVKITPTRGRHLKFDFPIGVAMIGFTEFLWSRLGDIRRSGKKGFVCWARPLDTRYAHR